MENRDGHFVRLKIPRQQCCAGSSPALGTKYINEKLYRLSSLVMPFFFLSRFYPTLVQLFPSTQLHPSPRFCALLLKSYVTENARLYQKRWGKWDKWGSTLFMTRKSIGLICPTLPYNLKYDVGQVGQRVDARTATAEITTGTGIMDAPTASTQSDEAQYLRTQRQSLI